LNGLFAFQMDARRKKLERGLGLPLSHSSPHLYGAANPLLSSSSSSSSPSSPVSPASPASSLHGSGSGSNLAGLVSPSSYPHLSHLHQHQHQPQLQQQQQSPYQQHNHPQNHPYASLMTANVAELSDKELLVLISRILFEHGMINDFQSRAVSDVLIFCLMCHQSAMFCSLLVSIFLIDCFSHSLILSFFHALR
jgi:hypothetical protein